jgi:hypothetical protein
MAPTGLKVNAAARCAHDGSRGLGAPNVGGKIIHVNGLCACF